MAHTVPGVGVDVDRLSAPDFPLPPDLLAERLVPQRPAVSSASTPVRAGLGLIADDPFDVLEVDIVRDEEPDMLYFAEHLSPDGSEASTVQVHANAEDMERHMALVSDHVRAATRYVDLPSMSITVYGEPTEAVSSPPARCRRR